MHLAAQALLSDWMSSKLRLELKMDEEDDPATPAVPTAVLPAFMDYNSFDGMHKPTVPSQALFCSSQPDQGPRVERKSHSLP